MRKLKLISILVFTGTVMMACGGNEENENSEETEVNDQINEESELDLQIVEDLDNATFKQYWSEKGGILIDLRTPEEVANGAIQGSVNIDYNAGDFDNAIDTLDNSVPTFVYCQGGGRSGEARDKLRENGFLEIYNLKDGYGNWEK